MTRDDYTDARVLIVDDEPANVFLLERVLGRAGYTALSITQDPREVFALYARVAPDLVLLDLHMPHMDGLEVLERLRPLVPSQSYVPVLVLTADGTEEAKRKALSAGAVDFLTKPLDVTEVLLRIRNLLHTRHLHLRMEEKVAERTRQLEDSQMEILERLSQAAEFRDDDTGQHTRRVGETSARVAEALGLPPAEVELIRRAAPLHDVGKIGIPDAILLKPGRLTPEEMEVMRTHTTVGARILADGCCRLVEVAEEVALTHHERWDGSGYPRGLAGEEIPLTGRIVAVADFFDALAHDRAYRKAWPEEEVLAEMRRLAGTHFDPRVLDAFFSMVRPAGAPA